MIGLLLVLLACTAGAFEADRARLEADVRALAGADEVDLGNGPEVMISRHIHHPDHEIARAWVKAAMEKIPGAKVWEEPFEAEGRDVANIVADLPGSNPLAPVILLGAHFDSTASLESGWDPENDPAPGADDDASGIAAILELGRMLAATPRVHGVRLVAFDAEEEGLLGSKHHAKNLDRPVRLMYSLDPIGYNPGSAGYLWVTFDARWPDDGADLEALGAGGPLAVTVLDAALIGGDRRSDHAPFWDEGVPALHLASFPQPPTYHTTEDDLANVDFDFLADVTSLVGEHTLAAAGTPKPRDASCASAPPATWWAVALLICGWRRPRERERE